MRPATTWPEGLVEGNRYDTSVAAEIITNISGYHLSIYRQQDQLAGDAKSQRIHEVFTKARAEGKPSVSGRMWAYRSLTVPINVFDFTVSRHRDGPDEFLVASNFTGTILADCYSGYQGISVRSDRGSCAPSATPMRNGNSSRRERTIPCWPVASWRCTRSSTTSRIAARRSPATVRQALRESEARPVWQRLRALVDGEECAKLLPKDKFPEALGYLRNHGNELQVYLGDGRLPIDNKIASYYASLVG